MSKGQLVLPTTSSPKAKFLPCLLQCLGQAWYLSVDVQLYILCPLVLVWLCRPRAPAAPAIPPAPAPRAAPLAPRSATAALAVAVAASLIAVSAYSFSNNWPASMLNFA